MSVADALERINLSDYAEAFEAQGYDSRGYLQSLSESRLREVAA